MLGTIMKGKKTSQDSTRDFNSNEILIQFNSFSFAGFLVDITGTFNLTFLLMGGGMAMAGICIGIQPLVVKISKNTNIELW